MKNISTVVLVSSLFLVGCGSDTQSATDESTSIETMTLTQSFTDTQSLTHTDTSTDTNVTTDGDVTYTDTEVSSTDTHTSTELVNIAPVIDIAQIKEVNELSPVTLSASVNDEDGQIVEREWRNISNNDYIFSVVSGSHNADELVLLTPELTQAETFIFEYSAKDDKQAQTSKQISFTVNPVNQAPIADAGLGKRVNRLSAVLLDGSNSLDIDEDNDGKDGEHYILTYQWKQSGSDNMQIALEQTDQASLQVDIPYIELSELPMTLSFELTVIDNEGASHSDTVAIDVIDTNQAPLAHAGAVQTVNEYELTNEMYLKPTIVLDGTLSSDPDVNPDAINNELKYVWSWTQDKQSLLSINQQQLDLNCQNPSSQDVVTCMDLQVQVEQIEATFNGLAPIVLDHSDIEQGKVTFEAPSIDVASTYYFELVVIDYDGTYSVESDEGLQFTSVTIKPVNLSPTVSIESTSTELKEGSVTQLVASAKDSDGTIQSYLWEQVSGPAAVMADQTKSTARFSAPPVLVGDPQVVTFSVVAIDNEGLASSKQEISFNVVGENLAPGIMIQAPQTIADNSTGAVLLDYNDADGQVVSTAISQVSGPSVSIVGSLKDYQLTPSNLIGDVTAEFKVTVIDNEGGISEQTFKITINDANQAPSVIGGKTNIANGLSETSLVAFISDDFTPEAQLSITWEQLTGDTVILDDPSILNPTFTAPEVLEDTHFQFRITVRDEEGKFASSTYTVIVQDHYPLVSIIADAQNNEQVEHTFEVNVQLRDGDVVEQYVWTLFIDGQQIDLGTNDTAKYTSDNIIGEALSGNLVANINTVNGGGRDQVSISFIDTNTAPVANAGRDQHVPSNLKMKLNGKKSKDQDGDALSFVWQQVMVSDEPSVFFIATDLSEPEFVTPTVDSQTDLTFELMVSDVDGKQSESADQVTITVSPVTYRKVNQTGILDSQCADFAYGMSGSFSHQTNLDCNLDVDPVEGDPIPKSQDGHYAQTSLQLLEILTAAGESPNNVGCMYDETTKLMWQIPTNTQGKGWYNSDAITNGGHVGNPNEGSNIASFTADINNFGLCGYSDWRIPTREELISIADYGSVLANKINPSFGDLSNIYLYTSETVVDDVTKVWGVKFGTASELQIEKIGFHPVMLVRDASTSPVINIIEP